MSRVGVLKQPRLFHLLAIRPRSARSPVCLLYTSYPQRTAIVTQEIFQRLWIIHSIKPPHKVNGISACLLILVIPQVPPDGNLCTAVLPFVLRTRPFQGMPLPAQQIRKVGQPCLLYTSYFILFLSFTQRMHQPLRLRYLDNLIDSLRTIGTRILCSESIKLSKYLRRIG